MTIIVQLSTFNVCFVSRGHLTEYRLNKAMIAMAIGSCELLTLHVQHHAVRDPFTPVGHNARQLLFVGLAARDQHVVAPDGHGPVLVASLL